MNSKGSIVNVEDQNISSLCVKYYQTDERNILKLCINEQEWKKVHQTLFRKRPLQGHFSDSFKEFKKQFVEKEYSLAKNYTLYLLGLKGYSIAEITKKLEAKLVSKASINKVIAYCTENQYLDDEQLAQRLVESQIEQGKKGPQLLKQVLYKRGLQEYYYLIQESYNADKEACQVRKIIAKYSASDLENPKEKNRIIARLVRKGFKLDIIFSILSEKSDEDHWRN